MLFWILKIILFIPSLIIYPVRVIGRKNLAKKGRVILVANHQTLNDAIIIGLRFCRRFYFMGKATLFKKKFMSWLLKQVGAYPVHRSSSDITAVKTSLRLLKEEKALCIFPEGTRLKSDENAELKNGVALFALKTQSPIVPACFLKITNAFNPNTLIVGEAFNLSEMEEFKDKKIDKELLTKASLIISKKMKDLKIDYINKKSNKNNINENN